MNRRDILDRLRENDFALRELGVVRARGGSRPDSGTGVMIEAGPSARITVYGYVGLNEFIARLFDGPVDAVSRVGRCHLCLLAPRQMRFAAVSTTPILPGRLSQGPVMLRLVLQPCERIKNPSQNEGLEGNGDFRGWAQNRSVLSPPP